MKVLIIGGAGYIGAHVAWELADRGHDLVIFDNFASGSRENIHPKANFVHGDILNFGQVLSAMEGCAGLIHLAAAKAAGESMVQPERYAWQNLSGTINVLNAACAHKIRAFVFSSSAAVYGEPQFQPITEEHAKNPTNFYGFTKLKIEELLDWYHRLRGLPYAALRYFNAAGYDQRVQALEFRPQNLIPLVMETALGWRSSLEIFGTDYPTPDGSCLRDYIHVIDLARAHAQAFDQLIAGSEPLVLNLGSGQGHSVLQVVEVARKITGCPIAANKVARRPGDPASLLASAELAHKKLGWKTTKYSNLDEIISSTWETYQRVNKQRFQAIARV